MPVATVSTTKDIDNVKPLFERYMWHMKEYLDIEDVHAWIRAANKYFELYRTDDNRDMYVVSTSDELYGFALVGPPKRFNSEGKAIVDFYILPDYQRQGHGTKLARYAFSQYHGLWEVCVLAKNTNAGKFWGETIAKITNNQYSRQTNDSYEGAGFTFRTTL